MKKLSTIVFICVPLITMVSSSVYAADTLADLSIVGQKITSLQEVETGLPSVADPKGSIGTLLGKIFDTSGKIGNVYLKAIGTITSGYVPRWNGTSLVNGQIRDDGTNVGIGGATTSGVKLNVTGPIRTTANIRSNNYCDANGTSCFTPSEIDVSGGIIGGTGTANYITKFTGGATIANSSLQDTGSAITTSSTLAVDGILGANAGIQVDGKNVVDGLGRQVTANWNDDTRYGFFEVRNNSGQRGAYFGFGNGAGTVSLALENASVLSISGGNVTISGTASAATPTASTHLTTKAYVDAATAGSNLWTLNGSNISRNTGNVGIGTTSPDESLQVVGNIMIGETDTTGGTLQLYGTTAGAYSRLLTTNGNLHIDSGMGTSVGNGIYLNYYTAGNVVMGSATSESDLTVNGEINQIGKSTNAYGITGRTASTGHGGVLGYSENATVYGILGHANAYGVYGQSASQWGVYGRTTNASYGGVFGYNHDATAYGILGYGADIGVQSNKKIVMGREGLKGTYTSTQVQGIWSIGNGYDVDISANDFGGQWGLVYSHTNAGTAAMGGKNAIPGQSHQILFTGAGVTRAMVSLTNGNAQFNQVKTTCIGNCF